MTDKRTANVCFQNEYHEVTFASWKEFKLNSMKAFSLTENDLPVWTHNNERVTKHNFEILDCTTPIEIESATREKKLRKKAELQAQEETKKREEETKKREEATKNLEEITHKFIQTGIPPLGTWSGSATKPSLKGGHAKANAILRTFNSVKWPFFPIVSGIWAQAHINYGHESDIAFFANLVLKDVIKSLNLANKIETRSELGIFRVRPDIWIIRIRGAPIGVVEVKRPDKRSENDLEKEMGVMTDAQTHGQLYDYMMRMKTFYGIKHVFGILTTYEKWRFFWFPESDEYAASTSIPSGQDSLPNLPQLPEEQPLVGVPQEVEEEKMELQREFHTSDIFHQSSGPKLTELLGSIVLKMFHSPFDPVKLFSSDRPYIVLDKDTWYWSRIKKFHENFQLWNGPIPKTLEKVVLLQDCGAGADGRVWIACTLSGQVLAIKFANIGSANVKNELEMEQQNWKDMNDEETAIHKLGSDWALVMPRAKPVENPNQKTKDEVLEAATRISKKGLFHGDLAWRHVGVLSPAKPGQKPKIVFIDLARVEKKDPDEALMLFKKQLNL